MNIEEIIQEGEGTTLEFKENINSENGILSTIIAFANTSGGRILVGIQDKTHHVIGIEDPHKISEALASKIHDTIQPRILPNIEILPYRNTHLIFIEVYPSALRPHFKKSKGKEKSTYIRIGSTTRLADEALLSVIERSVISKSFDEELCYEANCEEIDFTATSQLFGPYRKLRQSDLVSLGIVTKNGKDMTPTIAGILLFGKNRLRFFPDAWVQIGVFKGIDKETILDTQKITSLFPKAIDDVLSFLKRNMQVGLKIEDARHQEIWEVPKVALREAVINAIVHTDYSLTGAPIRIAIFDDRIEIENSALLPWGLTFEDLKSGVSKLRNPIIARVFNEMGLIEQWGSGIKRMTNACIEAGLSEPHFQEIGPRIRVTFYREKIFPPAVDDIDQLILDLLNFCGPLSTHQITNCVSISKRSIINRLSGMIDKGQIIELAQSPNDPKKKYALTEGKNKLNVNDLIREAFWNYSADPLGSILIRIELGRNCIDLVFCRNIVEDYFLDKGGTSSLQNKAIDAVKNVVTSEPIFGEILLKAIADEKIQEAFKRKEIAKFLVRPKEFGERDFRRTNRF